MSSAAEEQAIRAEINKYLDPDNAGRKLAHRLSMILLRAPSDDLAFSALIAAAALFLSDPHDTKANAMANAKSFGEQVEHEVGTYFETFATNRRRAFPPEEEHSDGIS